MMGVTIRGLLAGLVLVALLAVADAAEHEKIYVLKGSSGSGQVQSVNLYMLMFVQHLQRQAK